MNIADAFEFQATYHPTSLAVCVPGSLYGPVSYGRLRAITNNVGWRCLSAGIKPGDIVAIISGDPVFHLALILALTRIGAVSLSSNMPTLPDEFPVNFAIADDLRPVVNCDRVLRPDRSWMSGEGKPLPAGAKRGEANEPLARIVMTSATTGDPKGIPLTHEMMIRRMQACDGIFGDIFPTCSRILLDIGLTTSWGYLWAMKILGRGGTVFFRGADPAETLQALGLYGVAAMIASPSGIAEFLDLYERSPAFDCPLRAMMSSGGLLSTALSERVRARMCTHLIATYGATEITPLASAPAHRIAGIKGAVGFIAPWIGAETVDGRDRTLDAGEQGRVRFRGHTCVSSYVGHPQIEQTVFKDGWFYPGDIGTITEDRLLIIAGREKAVLNVGGNKMNPETIESVLTSFPGVIHAGALVRTNDLGVDEIWALVSGNDDIDARALREHCTRHLPALFVPANIFKVPEIPRNDMGRIMRSKLVDAVPANPVKP